MAKPRVARPATTADAPPNSDLKRRNLQFRAPDRVYAARVAALARAKGITEPALLKLAMDKYLNEAEGDLQALRQEIRERWENAASDELAALDELARLSAEQAAAVTNAATAVPGDSQGAMPRTATSAAKTPSADGDG